MSTVDSLCKKNTKQQQLRYGKLEQNLYPQNETDPLALESHLMFLALTSTVS